MIKKREISTVERVNHHMRHIRAQIGRLRFGTRLIWGQIQYATQLEAPCLAPAIRYNEGKSRQ